MAVKNFYLRLAAEKLYAFAVFTEKYLLWYGCSEINFTAAVNCTNPKTEMQTEIIKIQISGIQSTLQQKKYLSSSGKLVCSQLINWPTAPTDWPTAPTDNQLLQPLQSRAHWKNDNAKEMCSKCWRFTFL